MALADKFVGITELARKSGDVVSRLGDGENDEVFVLKNSEPVAVLMSTGAYDRLQELEAQLVHLEDALLVLAAKEKDDGTNISLEELDAKYPV